MAVLFFKLRGVPDDEADEVRELLKSNHINFYETPEGRWKISMPAIWLQDKPQFQTAQNLLSHYQLERKAKAQDEYQRLKEAGEHRTIIDVVKEDPVRFIGYVGAILFILYISIKPFTDIGQ